MPRGRPSSLEDRVTWHIPLPASLAAKIELLFYDPLTGRVSYGKRAELVVKLLSEWLEKETKKANEEHSNDRSA